MTDFSPAMLHAFEDTIFAYDVAIADLENGVDFNVVSARWRNAAYGTHGGCRMCNTSRSSYASYNCEVCILGPGQHACVRATGGVESYNDLMQEAYEGISKKTLLRAFKARRAWLIKQAGRSGIVLEDA